LRTETLLSENASLIEHTLNILLLYIHSGDGMFRNNLDGLRCWTANMPLSHHG